MDFRAELELPSVIIDVPELQQMIAKKKMMHTASLLGAAVLFLALAGLIFIELTAGPKEVVTVEAVETEDAASITLTVKLFPENISGAVVEVDGERISGNPPYVYLTPSEDYHSVKVTAPGYAVVSKDVQVTASEVMTFALSATIDTANDSSDESALASADEFDTDSFGENSDDLIEEIDESQEIAFAAMRQQNEKGGERSGARRAARRAENGSGRSAGGKREKQGATGGSVRSPATRSVNTTPSSSATNSGGSGNSRAVATGVEAAPAAGQPPAKASLIINAPLGVSSRVAVSVDGQMRGYLPVLLKIDAGLHELTFVYEGHRSFQMVKLSAGQISRIIPNL